MNKKERKKMKIKIKSKLKKVEINKYKLNNINKLIYFYLKK